MINMYNVSIEIERFLTELFVYFGLMKVDKKFNKNIVDINDLPQDVSFSDFRQIFLNIASNFTKLRPVVIIFAI